MTAKMPFAINFGLRFYLSFFWEKVFSIVLEPAIGSFPENYFFFSRFHRLTKTAQFGELIQRSEVIPTLTPFERVDGLLTPLLST
jgi:hypothetical protein